MLRFTTCTLFLISGCRCGTADFQPDEAARICVTLQTCSPQEFRATFGASLEFCTTNTSPGMPMPGTLEASPPVATGLDQPMRELYSCMLDAGADCNRAGQCWSLGTDGRECPNRSGLAFSSCRDQVLSACTADGHQFRVDCARSQSICTQASFFGSPSVCAFAKCRPSLSCHGTQRELCLGDAIVLLDCARDGRRCEEVDGGAPRCVADGLCGRTDQASCEGSVSVTCGRDGFEVRTDCAVNPTRRRCGADAGVCVPTGTACANLRVTCEGDSVQFCQDGFVRKVNCVSAGFAGCDAGACVRQ